MFLLLAISSVLASEAEQHASLIQFYDSTDGANWKPNNWLQTDVYCEWTGVGCDDNSNVVSLHLPGMGLNGQLSDLSGLQYLTILNLNTNTLKDSDLCLLKGLSYLRVLSMIDVKLDGNLPECICALPKLHTLHIDNNTLIGDIPPCLGDRLQLFTARCNGLQYSSDKADVAGIDYTDVACNPSLECGDNDYSSFKAGHYSCGTKYCSACAKRTTCPAFLDVNGCRLYFQGKNMGKGEKEGNN